MYELLGYIVARNFTAHDFNTDDIEEEKWSAFTVRSSDPLKDLQYVSIVTAVTLKSGEMYGNVINILRSELIKMICKV